MKRFPRVSYPVIFIFAIGLFAGCERSPIESDRSEYFLLEDTTLRLSAEEAWSAFQLGKYQRINAPSLNPGFTQSYFWLAIKKNTSKSPSQLEIGTPHINKIELYQIRDSLPVRTATTGDHFLYRERPLPTLNFVFPLDDKAGFYLAKIDKVSEALQVTFQTRSAEQFNADAVNRYMIAGILTGLLLLMCIFGLFLFFISREQVYLYYVLYMIVGWIYVLANLGYGYKYLWPESAWMAERARPIFSLLTLTFSFHFMVSYIEKANSKWLHYVLKGAVVAAYISVVLVFLGFAVKPKTFTGYYFQIGIAALSLIYLAALFTTLIQKVLNRNKMAVFYLLSLLPLVVFSALQLIYYSGGVDFSFTYLQDYGQPTGYVLQAIILTFGLAFRFNTYRLEKEQLLIETNKQQVLYAKAIITTQEQERRQLADQLHDVAGSLLSSAKLNLSSVREKNFITNDDARIKLAHAEEAVTDISGMLRNLSHAISPIMMDKVGFRQSVEKIVGIFNSTGKIKVELEMLGFEQTLPEWHERFSVFYGILYELMNNIVKHANAQHALIQLIEHDDSFVMVVEDDGIGLKRVEAEISSTHGLAAIKSKIHYFKGTVVFDSAVPHGLIVAIEIPKEEDD